MTPTISAKQRDALYEQILDRLSGIGEISVAIDSHDYDVAKRLGREFSDDLRLLLDDLGIGDGSGKSVTLTSPPEMLRRVLPRLSQLAEAHLTGLDREPVEANDLKERKRLVTQACSSVLAELGAG